MSFEYAIFDVEHFFIIFIKKYIMEQKATRNLSISEIVIFDVDT